MVLAPWRVVLPVSDRDWFGIRAAARRRDWLEVAERAEATGWPILARNARRLAAAAGDEAALRAVVWGLRLDLPDLPDPLGEAQHA